MKKIIFSTLALVGAFSFAQEEQQKSFVDFTAGLETRQVWRGTRDQGNPVITAKTSLFLTPDRALSVGAWGGMTFDGAYKEIDLFVEYTKGGFTIGLWDLYVYGDNDTNVFDYKQATTGHLLDLRTKYFFGEQMPLTLEADFILYGKKDARLVGSKEERKQKISTYFEASYAINAGEGITFVPFLGTGFALNGKGEKEVHMYAAKGKFGVVNTGFHVDKTVSFGSYKLPLRATTAWNPADGFVKVALKATFF